MSLPSLMDPTSSNTGTVHERRQYSDSLRWTKSLWCTHALNTTLLLSPDLPPLPALAAPHHFPTSHLKAHTHSTSAPEQQHHPTMSSFSMFAALLLATTSTLAFAQQPVVVDGGDVFNPLMGADGHGQYLPPADVTESDLIMMAYCQMSQHKFYQMPKHKLPKHKLPVI